MVKRRAHGVSVVTAQFWELRETQGLGCCARRVSIRF